MNELTIAREALVAAHTVFTAAKATFDTIAEKLAQTSFSTGLSKEAEFLIDSIVTFNDGDRRVQLAERAYIEKHTIAVANHKAWLTLNEASNVATAAMTEALDKLERAKAAYFNLLAPYTQA